LSSAFPLRFYIGNGGEKGFFACLFLLVSGKYRFLFAGIGKISPNFCLVSALSNRLKLRAAREAESGPRRAEQHTCDSSFRFFVFFCPSHGQNSLLSSAYESQRADATFCTVRLTNFVKLATQCPVEHGGVEGLGFSIFRGSNSRSSRFFVFFCPPHGQIPLLSTSYESQRADAAFCTVRLSKSQRFRSCALSNMRRSRD